ncbi:MAG: tripartite tricarboxylate transporter substrate binding protein [Pigmentiphaga sp.]|uniref:Bug family tripartite tricarboxylate transporter substrate binding protein n=1 Tax=Pigmentiphaga sp. TaxID=1977564 RepID=UPI0029BD6E34|nr:tripartite tricarboxylate transporter substrate binding protein [Pigmentiphaga sp.]MDX3906328.1 tripartite tricarboxylate transporter substrate binding protein [Pigmentiphaga sp.]
MALNRRQFILSTIAAAASGRAAAQDFPTRSISVVVGAAPGGPNDIVARLVSEQLAQQLGAPVVIENKPGASGFIAATDIKGAPPDGYRLLFAYTGLMAINPWLFKSLPYDPIADFAPLSLVAKVPQVLLVRPQLGVRTVAELRDWLRQHPNEAAYGSAGIGTPLHIAGELFLSKAGLRAVHIPYKGSSPAYSELLSGRIHFLFDGVPGVLPYIKSGKFVPLAVTGKVPLAQLPNVPTLADAGLEGADVESWFGFAAPAAVPLAVRRKLTDALIQAVQTRQLRTRLEELGVQPWGTTGEEMAAFVASEQKRWHQLVNNAGVHPE